MKVKMRVEKVKRETYDTCTLTLRSDKRPDFKPGQFFMVELLRTEKIPKRSYSTSSSPTREGILDFTVKQVPDGWVSKLLCEVKEGEELMVDGPWGHFVFDEAKMPEIVMLSAGSGIAPFRCFCQYIVDKGLGTKATLVYSNKTEEDIICRQDLEELAKNIPGMELKLALTREEKQGFHFGRIDDTMVKSLVSRSPAAHYFICGPPAMVSGVEQLLLANGIVKEKIKTEKYG